MWLAIKAFFSTNALKVLQLLSALIAVILILLGAKNSGKNAERAAQYEDAIKKKQSVDNVKRRDAANSLRTGTF